MSIMFDKTEDELKKDYSYFLEDKFKGSFIEYEFSLKTDAEKLLSKSSDEIKSDKDQKEDKYVGELINGKPNGKGTKTFANGNTYSGEWKNGDFHGKGTYINHYGQRFEGYWENGKIYNGELFYKKGVYPNSQDEKYIGELAYSYGSPVPHGEGIYYFSNGDIYNGDFFDWSKEGSGTFTWKNGDSYTGEWSGDKFNGYGVLTKNGIKTEGIWEDGEIVSDSDKYLTKEAEFSISDRELLLEIFKTEGAGEYLEYASNDLKSDRDVVIKAIKSSGLAFMHANQKFRNDREIILIACSTHYSDLVIANVPEFFREESDIVIVQLNQIIIH